MSILGGTPVQSFVSILGFIPGSIGGIGTDSNVALTIDGDTNDISTDYYGSKFVIANYLDVDGPTLVASIAKSIEAEYGKPFLLVSTPASDGTKLSLTWDPTEHLKIKKLGSGATGSYRVQII